MLIMAERIQANEGAGKISSRIMDAARNAIGSIFRKMRPPVLAKYIGGTPEFFRLWVVSPRLFWRRNALITRKTIRLVEKESIRDFVASQRNYLKGRVLDFGAGDQPYKELVDGEYVPFEKGENFPEEKFDTVLMNQVVQYLDDPRRELERLAKVTDLLVMTYPTHWEELEHIDYWRFTKAGMEKMLREAGFEIIHHEPRHALMFYDFSLVIGYGVIAKSTRQPG